MFISLLTPVLFIPSTISIRRRVISSSSKRRIQSQICRYTTSSCTHQFPLSCECSSPTVWRATVSSGPRFIRKITAERIIISGWLQSDAKTAHKHTGWCGVIECSYSIDFLCFNYFFFLFFLPFFSMFLLSFLVLFSLFVRPSFFYYYLLIISLLFV